MFWINKIGSDLLLSGIYLYSYILLGVQPVIHACTIALGWAGGKKDHHEWFLRRSNFTGLRSWLAPFPVAYY
jgi:hypothetical protein